MITGQSRVAYGLCIAVALQLCILAGMLLKASMPLWTGNEIRVTTVPFDPRSLFRGNYARLNYEIGRLPQGALSEHEDLRINEVVYVSLKENSDGLYEYSHASLDKPEQGTFLRGRIKSTRPSYRVEYGIEAFFAPKDKALQLEKDLREGGVAILMINDSGNVALKDVIPNNVN